MRLHGAAAARRRSSQRSSQLSKFLAAVGVFPHIILQVSGLSVSLSPSLQTRAMIEDRAAGGVPLQTRVEDRAGERASRTIDLRGRGLETLDAESNRGSLLEVDVDANEVDVDAMRSYASGKHVSDDELGKHVRTRYGLIGRAGDEPALLRIRRAEEERALEERAATQNLLEAMPGFGLSVLDEMAIPLDWGEKEEDEESSFLELSDGAGADSRADSSSRNVDIGDSSSLSDGERGDDEEDHGDHWPPPEELEADSEEQEELEAASFQETEQEELEADSTTSADLHEDDSEYCGTGADGQIACDMRSRSATYAEDATREDEHEDVDVDIQNSDASSFDESGSDASSFDESGSDASSFDESGSDASFWRVFVGSATQSTTTTSTTTTSITPSPANVTEPAPAPATVNVNVTPEGYANTSQNGTIPASQRDFWKESVANTLYYATPSLTRDKNHFVKNAYVAEGHRGLRTQSGTITILKTVVQKLLNTAGPSQKVIRANHFLGRTRTCSIQSPLTNFPPVIQECHTSDCE